jgi:hypothetical protein
MLQRFLPADVCRAPRRQQEQEECPDGFVFGSGSAAFRTLHDNIPFGSADAPPPSSAALPQGQFENWKRIQTSRSCLAKRVQMGPPKSEIRKSHLHGWSAGMHSLFDEMQSLFRVVNPEARSGSLPKTVEQSVKSMVGSGRPNSNVRLSAQQFQRLR